MNQLLREILNELYRLNNFIEGKAFSKDEIVEEEQNLADLVQTQEKLTLLLEKIKQCPLEEEEKFCNDIIDLHTLTNNLAWYFENLNENVNKIIRNYPFSEEFKSKNSLNK